MIAAAYVKKQAFWSIIATTSALLLLKLIFDYIAQLDKLTPDYSYIDALWYVLYRVPETLQIYMGTGALLGGVIGLGLLANHSELVVMQAAGISRLRLIGWVMQPALVLVVIGLLLSQYVVPVTNTLARQVSEPSSTTSTLTQNLTGYWEKQPERIIYIESANPQGQLTNVKIWNLAADGKLQQITQARTGSYQHQQTSSDYQWQLQQVQQLSLLADGRSLRNTLAQTSISLPLTPHLIYLLTREPDDMSLSELYYHQKFMATSQRRALAHEVTFWRKVLAPLSVISLVLVACSFIFGSLRTHSLGFRLVMALIFGLTFNYLQDLVGYISLSTGFMPWLMILSPIIASALLGLYLIRRRT